MAKHENERRRAVALAYQEGDRAPRVIAKGYGELAEQVIAEARRHGLQIHDAPQLIGLLMRVDLDERIPPALYRVIGELLAWVHGLEVMSENECE